MHANAEQTRQLIDTLKNFDSFNEAVRHLKNTFSKSYCDADYGGGTTSFTNGFTDGSDPYHALVYWDDQKVVVTNPDTNQALNIRFAHQRKTDSSETTPYPMTL